MKSIRELPWYIQLSLIFQYPGLDIEYQSRTVAVFQYFKVYKGEKYLTESHIVGLAGGSK